MPLDERPCNSAHVDTRGLGRSGVAHRQGTSLDWRQSLVECRGATDSEPMRRAGSASRADGARRGRGDNATGSSRIRAGSMTQAEVEASILEWFNSSFGSIFDVGAGFASETAAACSARTRPAAPPARRPVSRGRGAWTTPVGSPALSASRQLRSPSSSAARATPSPPSPSPPARWICAGPEYWSRLKRFGTVATRCDGSSAAVPTGRLPRSANGFY